MRYPTIAKQWCLKWADIIALFEFPRNRKSYPNAERALRLVPLAIHRASKKRPMPIVDWKAALNPFAIVVGSHIPTRPRTDSNRRARPTSHKNL